MVERLLHFRGQQPGLGGAGVKRTPVLRLTPPPALSAQELLSVMGGGYMQKQHSQL